MFSDRDLEGTEWEPVQETVRVHARKMRRRNLRCDYGDLYQSGWIGALMSRKKHGKQWSQMRELAGRRIRGEIMRFIVKSCNSRGPTFADTVRFDREIIRDFDLIADTVPETWIEDNETSIPSLESAIASLGPLQRKAVEVFFFGSDEKFDSVEQARSSKFHALRNLRKQLKEARISEFSDSTCPE